MERTSTLLYVVAQSAQGFLYLPFFQVMYYQLKWVSMFHLHLKVGPKGFKRLTPDVIAILWHEGDRPQEDWELDSMPTISFHLLTPKRLACFFIHSLNIGEKLKYHLLPPFDDGKTSPSLPKKVFSQTERSEISTSLHKVELFFCTHQTFIIYVIANWNTFILQSKP